MNADQWYYSKDDLYDTPTILDQTHSFAEEQQERIKCCHYIIAVGQKLQLPHLVVVTATTFLHRFYMRQSMGPHKPYDVAATCLFVATKVEEGTRKLRDIVAVCAAKAMKESAPLPEDHPNFAKWKEIILTKEIIVFDTLCFDLSIQHPQKYLLELEILLNAPPTIVRRAWMFLFASLGSTSCLLYKPNVLAAAALLLASNFPGSGQSKLSDNWYENVEGLDIVELHEVAADMLEFGTETYLKKSSSSNSQQSSPYVNSSQRTHHSNQQ